MTIDAVQNLLDDEHGTYLTNIVWLPQSTGTYLTSSRLIGKQTDQSQSTATLYW